MTAIEAMAIVRRLAARLGMPASAARSGGSSSILAYASDETEQVSVRRGAGVSLQFDGLTEAEAEALIDIWRACPRCGKSMPPEDRGTRYRGERMHRTCAVACSYITSDDDPTVT